MTFDDAMLLWAATVCGVVAAILAFIVSDGDFVGTCVWAAAGMWAGLGVGVGMPVWCHGVVVLASIPFIVGAAIGTPVWILAKVIQRLSK